MIVNKCECRKHSGKQLQGVIGIVWNESTTVERLRSVINKIEKELPLNMCELAICSIDTESAQKYGEFDSLELTKVVSTRSAYVLNFYMEYCENREMLIKQLSEYVMNHKGILIMIDPEGDEVLTQIRKHITENKCLDLYVFEDEKPDTTEPPTKTKNKKE